MFCEITKNKEPAEVSRWQP